MYYSQTLPIEQKKAIIKNTLNWYTKAGTPAAVSEMVDVVLGGGKVVEWFDFDEPPYTPGTFDIVTSALMTSDIMEELTGLVQKVKNVRSHVRRVIVERNIPSGMNACIWMFSTMSRTECMRPDISERQSERQLSEMIFKCRPKRQQARARQE